MSKLFNNADLLANAVKINEENSVDDVFSYLVEDFKDMKLSILCNKFIIGEWSKVENRYVDFYPRYFKGNLSELFTYFVLFLMQHGNYGFKELKKIYKRLSMKIELFSNFASNKV